MGWAGLWSADDAAAAWWHELATVLRGARSAARAAVGRDGEKLTLRYERERLHKDGSNRSPVWRSLEDDTLGYDIESWTTEEPPALIRIEAKAYAGTDRRLFLSRREWETALRFQNAFFFDLWELSTESLTRFRVADLVSVVPTDGIGGKWQEVLIRPAEMPKI
jgi:hypothetical protein